MAATIAVTLFDFDEVLCLFDRQAMCAHLAQSSPLSADQVFEQVWTSGLDAQADRGEISGQHYVQAIGQRLGRDLDLAQWVAARAAATVIIPGMLELAREVARRSDIAILTNNSELLVQHLPTICPQAADLFGAQVYHSSEFGMTKPDVKAYHGCVQRLGVRPEQVLFIDNRLDNVQGALAAGLHAHHFFHVQGLRAELADYGLV